MNEKRSLVSKGFFFTSVVLLIISWTIRSHGYEWSRTFGGSHRDVGRSVQQTTDGGYIIAGYTESFGAGAYDVYLIKTDAAGNELWSKTFGGNGYDYGYSVQQTTDGGYIIAGITHSFGAGAADVYLIKTDAAGNELWSKTFGGNINDYGFSVQQTIDGGYIIAGLTSSFGAGADDVYLIKTDVGGNELWSKTFGGSRSNWGESVQQTTDGGYIIAGGTESFGVSNYDVGLIKTDAAGNELWSETFGGSNQDVGASVQQTTDGGYIIAGYTFHWGDGYPEVYLIKTDAGGNGLWSKMLGEGHWDKGTSVQQTTDGGYIIAGYTVVFGYLGPDEVCLIKTDGGGNELWSKTFGGNGYDWGESVQQTTDGGYIIAGGTESFGAGEADVYLVYFTTYPSPDIKANGSDGPLTIPQGTNLTVTVALDPGGYDGEDADWWVMAKTPFGRHWYTLDSTLDRKWVRSDAPIRVHGGPLFYLSPYEVLNSACLPIGIYKFHFGVDLLMNGSLDFDELYFDSLDVTIELE